MRSQFFAGLLLCGFLAVSLSGCQKDDGKLRIAVIPKGTTHEFWESVHYGAEQAAKELGDVEILWKGATDENDTNGQMGVVRAFITDQVDGICLAPLDSSALVGTVTESVERNIPVVIFDSGLDDTSKTVSYVATNNYEGGKLAAEEMARALGNKGNVIMLRYNKGSESTEERERGFLETLEKLQKDHPELKVISENQYAGTKVKESQEKAMQVLGSYKEEANGIFAVCEPNAAGVLLALEELGLAGKIKFIAFDPNPQLVKGLEEGTVHGIVLQDPVKMGYEAVKAMVAHLKGEKVKARIETTVAVATPKNRETEEMKRLLEPPQFKD